MKLYIWGTGNVAKKYYNKGEISREDLKGFIVSKPSERTYDGIRIYSPDEIAGMEYDYILVCIYYETKNIMDLCEQYGIDLSKVLFIDCCEWPDGSSMKQLPNQCYRKIELEQDKLELDKLFPEFYSMMCNIELEASRYALIVRNGYDLVEKDNLLQSKEFVRKIYQSDYCRYRTFEFVANEIEQNKVPGSCAEVGVFKGDFARLINAKFRDRKMFLFDTFQSFDQEEYEKELKNRNCDESFFDVFTATSVEEVLNNMLYPERCVPRVGLFPQTAKGLEEERFAFVSVDVDFEESILESLRYFYPRLNSGGAIFLHDYNNRFLGGVKIAVRRYEKEMKGFLMKVPIADEGGTLVIMKQ